jgi:hypothetical protein
MSEPSPSLLPAALFALLCFGAVDAVTLMVVATPARLAEPTPLDDGPTLVARLGAIRRHDGPTVALLGDSVVYGHALQEHDAGDWRAQNLAPALQGELAEHALAVNLGMNGALPLDQSRLLPLVLAAEPDLVVLDVSLRSFSADFREPAEAASRPWLTDVLPTATFSERRQGQPWGEQLTRGLRAGASRVWALYGHRAWMQARFLDGVPRDAVSRHRDAVVATLEGQGPLDEDAAFDAELALMLRTKARYATVDLEGHPQAEALRQILAALAEAEQPAVLFYATENPSLLPSLVDLVGHRSDLAALERLIGEGLGAQQVWLGPEDSAEASTFLDHVHRNVDGLKQLAQAVATAAPSELR